MIFSGANYFYKLKKYTDLIIDTVRTFVNVHHIHRTVDKY